MLYAASEKRDALGTVHPFFIAIIFIVRLTDL